MNKLKLSGIAGLVGSIAAVAMVLTAGVAYATIPTFSQSSVTVGVGQSTSITPQNNIPVYVYGNTGPTTVTVSISGGTQVTLTGLAPGSASLTLCNVGTASDCTNLGVTVQTGAVTGVAFSLSNPTLAIGSNEGVTVSGGNGNYSVSSNSNTTVVSTGISGSVLTINGLAAGSATIKVCDSSNNCGNLNVSVNSTATSNSTSSLSFNPGSFTLTTGGSQIVSITGGSGAYNISNNANPSILSVGMTGSTNLIVEGSAPGTGNVTLCDTSPIHICGTLSVTVGGSGSTASAASGAVTFVPASPTLTVGQTQSVTLSGGTTGYVVFANDTPNVVQATIPGNASTLTLTGMNAGSATVTVCATAGGCASVAVTVTGTGTATTTPPPVTTSPVTTTPAPVATIPTTIAPTTTGVVNSTLLAEIQTLQAAVTGVLTQIQSIQSQLNQLQAQVNAGGGGTTTTGVSAGVSAPASGGLYNFTELLTLGSQDAQVTALQNRLAALGFYSGPTTGFYGSLTEQAVIKYQTAHGIEATGSLGPLTRAALDAGE